MILVLLLPVAVLAFALAVFMFTIHAWARALVDLLEARFIRAGVWTCVGIFMVAGHDMKPVYVAVMVVAVMATVIKRGRRQLANGPKALEFNPRA